MIEYLDTVDQQPVYTDFEDTISSEMRDTGPPPPVAAEIYHRRVAKFIREHQEELVIRKLRGNRPITALELAALEAMLFDGAERGTREGFAAVLGVGEAAGAAGPGNPLLAFVRSIVGLDPVAVDELFAGFINAYTLSSAQINFIEQIKRHLQRNGLLEPRVLFEDPYTSGDPRGLGGVFDEVQQARIVGLVRAAGLGLEVA